MIIAAKTVVALSYELYDGDGKLIEKGSEPMEYLHGTSGIFPLVEQALEGKQVGDTVKVHLAPGDAFGEYDAELVRMEEQAQFPADAKVGMQFEGKSSNGHDTVVYTVTDIAEGKVVVDGNHPLAGKTLNFQGTVNRIRKATREELSHGHVHGAHGHHH